MAQNGSFSEESLRKIAEEKINFRASVKIHLMAYVLVQILLLVINMIFTPGLWWIMYPFLGWGIGLLLHLTSYILYARGVYPWNKRFVIYHIVIYLSTMVLLLSIDYVTMGGLTWSFYPGFFWGLGLIAHIIVYFVYFSERMTKEGKPMSKKDKAIEKELAKMKSKIDK